MQLKSIILCCVTLTRILTVVKGDHDRPNITLKDKPPLKVKLSTESSWIKESLKRHNYYRSLHNVQPLKLNKTLSEMSQAWGNYLLTRATISINASGEIEFFDHNYDTISKHNVGQNLYYLSANYDKLSPGLAVNLWYNEIKEYDFQLGSGKHSQDSLYGHFSQLMWKSSTHFGTAYSTIKFPNNQSLTFVVAYYYQRGNMFGSEDDTDTQLFIENVPPPVANISSPENSIVVLINKNKLAMGNVTTPASWSEAAVAKHNDYRAQFGVPELLMSDELCQTSQARADQLLKTALEEFNKNQNFVYRKNTKSPFGENVMYFVTTNSEYIDPSVPLYSWFENEKNFYDFNKRATDLEKSKTAKTYHFEQIVWKSTTHVCMVYSNAIAENGEYVFYILAQYYPSSGQGGNKTLDEKMANIPLEKNGTDKKLKN